MIFDKEYDVFVSYRHNNMTLIGEVVHRLEKYYDVFWDQRLESGFWNEQLTGAINNSRAVLINFTADSLKKNMETEDWFYKEIVYSIDNKKKEEIIPVCYDGFEFPANFDIEGITPNEKEKLRLLKDKYQRITDIKDLDTIIEKIITYLSGIGIKPMEGYIRSNGRDLSLKYEKILPVRYFVGRETELQKMIELVHINDIVFLSGIGGIGKTELAKKFMEEMTGEYRCIFLRYEASLENTLAKIEINGLEGAEFKEKEPELKKLLNDNVVLVIDNFDFDSDENIDDYIYEFCKYPCKKLITTRNTFSELEFPCETGFITISELKKDELKNLFEEKYNETITEEQFEKIYEFTGGLTLIVPILASLCRKSDMTVEELCEKVSRGLQGLKYSDSVNYVKDGNKKGSVPEILRVLFNIDEISEEKKQTLRNLSLLQFIEVTKEVYRNLAFRNGEGNLDAFNDLVDAGWIKQTGHSGAKAVYELHPLINSLVKDALKPSVKNCPEITNKIIAKDKVDPTEKVLVQFLGELNLNIEENYRYLASSDNVFFALPYCGRHLAAVVFSKVSFDNTDVTLACDVIRLSHIREKEENKRILLERCLEGKKNKTVSPETADEFIVMYCSMEIGEQNKKLYDSPSYEAAERVCKELQKHCSSKSAKKKINDELSRLKYSIERCQYIKTEVEAVIEKLHQSKDIYESFDLVETVWRICGLEARFKYDIYMHFLKEDSTKEEVEHIIDATIKRYGYQDLHDEYYINEGIYIVLALTSTCEMMKYDFLSYEKCYEFMNALCEDRDNEIYAALMCGDTKRIKNCVDKILFSKPIEEKTSGDIFSETSVIRYLSKGLQNGDYPEEYIEKLFGNAEAVIAKFGTDKKSKYTVSQFLKRFEESLGNEKDKNRVKELRNDYLLKTLGIKLKKE